MGRGLRLTTLAPSDSYNVSSHTLLMLWQIKITWDEIPLPYDVKQCWWFKQLACFSSSCSYHVPQNNTTWFYLLGFWGGGGWVRFTTLASLGAHNVAQNVPTHIQTMVLPFRLLGGELRLTTLALSDSYNVSSHTLLMMWPIKITWNEKPLTSDIKQCWRFKQLACFSSSCSYHVPKKPLRGSTF